MHGIVPATIGKAFHWDHQAAQGRDKIMMEQLKCRTSTYRFSRDEKSGSVH